MLLRKIKHLYFQAQLTRAERGAEVEERAASQAAANRKYFQVRANQLRILLKVNSTLR